MSPTTLSDGVGHASATCLTSIRGSLGRVAAARARGARSIGICHGVHRSAVAIGLLLTAAAALAVATPQTASAAGLSWSAPTRIVNRAPFDAGIVFNAVSCASLSLCVAVDADGNIVTSTDPDAGARARWSFKQVRAERRTQRRRVLVGLVLRDR